MACILQSLWETMHIIITHRTIFINPRMSLWLNTIHVTFTSAAVAVMTTAIFFFFTVFCIQTVQTVCTFTSWGQKRAISSAATPHLCAYILHGSATVQTTVGTTQTRPTARVSTSTKTLVICWFRGNPSLITREISFFTVDWNKIYWGLEKIMSLCSARSQWSDVVVAFLSSFSWAEVRGRPLCLS